jgi:hypothetical protein
MLQHLRLRNFKNWKDTTHIQMAPLTVLFGTNSSGKSSIEQFLLMLKQTVDSSDRKLVLFPGDVSTAVNLGSFEEFIYGRDPKNKLEFSFGWQLAVRSLRLCVVTAFRLGLVRTGCFTRDKFSTKSSLRCDSAIQELKQLRLLDQKSNVLLSITKKGYDLADTIHNNS